MHHTSIFSHGPLDTGLLSINDRKSELRHFVSFSHFTVTDSLTFLSVLHPANVARSASRLGGAVGTGCCLRQNIGQDSNMEHLEEDGEGTVAPGLPAVIMMYNLIEGCASILRRTQTALLLSMHYSG